MRSILISICAASMVLTQTLVPLSAGAQQQQQPAAPAQQQPTVTVTQQKQIVAPTQIAPTQIAAPAQQPLIVAADPMATRSSTTGSLICSAAIGNSTACGTTKADYVGAYKLNLKCDNGFYDPIYGGTCWKCPDETDGKGGWIRSATAVTGDDACWRVPKESLASATKVKKTSWAWECPSGSFWDGYDWGGCWTCPSDYPRRTMYPVYDSKACATPVNETRTATLLTFNGCPKPDAEAMKLKGKRLPGKPFLDIAGGWNQGVASGGCYACPVTDEEGNILITQRNASPIYGENKGCDVLFKWKPGYFQEPGLAGIAGMKEFIAESNLLDSGKVTAGLYFQAGSRGMKIDSPDAKAWVTKQWEQISRAPYQSDAFRMLVYQNLLMVAAIPAAQRTPAQTNVLNAFQEHIRQRRIYIAQMGLAMYDAWKAYDDKAKQSVKRSRVMEALDYGTVPLDFHATLGAAMSLGGAGVAVAGAMTAGLQYASQLTLDTASGVTLNTAPIGGDQVSLAANLMMKVPINEGGRFVSLAKSSEAWKLSDTAVEVKDLSDVLRPLNLFKGTVAANTALVGATVIVVAFAIIQSVAIDQFIAIQTARPKLEAALAVAQQPITVNDILSQPNGSDVLLYHWSKSMESEIVFNDPQTVALASAAYQKAQSSGYRLPGAQ